MAEAIVSFVVEKLGELLLEKITFLRGVRGQLERLQNELKSIKGFLKTADSIQNQYPDIRVWVADVRDIAYDVDDIIDAFLLKIASKERVGSNNVLMRCARLPKKLFNFNNVGNEIDSIVAKIKEISERRKRYDGITSVVKKEGTISSSSNEMPLRRVYPHTDDVIVGLEDQTNILVAELLKEEDRLCVISIHGMGGLGKSTLATKVYNHLAVKRHFDCYAWTSISQKLNIKATLHEILRKVSTLTSKDMADMSEAELHENLVANLERKRYLVVLDDIWSTRDWDALKSAFPIKKGSKVMFTTRNSELGAYADRWSFHLELRPLYDNEAWELLCRKVFPPNVSGSSCCLSSAFEECGRNIVKKCGGFPLQVIVLGGILSSKETIEQWEAVSKQIRAHTSHGQDDEVIPILSMSYKELPYNMKPLFLYLGLFPEDFLIPVKMLVRMWMAESLIRQENGEETIEEIGTRYLEKLIHRSMVQIGEKNMGGKKIKTCRLHDEMRKLCITIGREENFFGEINVKGGSSSPSCSARTSNKLRRCAIYLEQPCEQNFFPKQHAQSLRTAIFIERDLSISIINFKDFKILKVLNLEDRLSVGNEDARLLGKLTNLRYLRIIGYWTNAILVKSFKNLVCLQTLDLPYIVFDGKDIFNTMHQLRHLYGFEIKLSTINKMANLQTLFTIRAGPWMTDLAKLTSLEKLGIKELDEKTLRLLTPIISDGGLDKLRSLDLQIYFCEGFGFPLDLLEALSGKRRLQKLLLWGKISKLPSQFPSNLIKLSLSMTHSSEDLMPTLEKLQHLLFLNLFYAYDGKEMVCSANGFPKLQCLKLDSMNQLEEWTVEKGAMPCLTTCWIDYCKNLKMVPHGFKFLTMLQKLKVYYMPNSFEERVKQGGEDWETVQHIPSITISNTLGE